MKNTINEVLARYNKDAGRLMDILIDIQNEAGYISNDAISTISKECCISSADVDQTISFYHFFSRVPRGKYTIFLNTSITSYMAGRDEVARCFEKEAGCKFGSVSKDGLIGLFETACIGMNDQEPAALINGIVFTRLTPYRVRELAAGMRAGKNVNQLIAESYGDGKNADIRTMVFNNIRKTGPVLDSSYIPGTVLKNKLSTLTAEQVIGEIKNSGMRGRGGAGFPTGMKWDLCHRSKGNTKYIFCNADEGEPGTFKDRVILTERPLLLFEGMAIAGYATGATEGIIYLRHEYKYMQQYLDAQLTEARKQKMLGKDIAGIKGFSFDIRVQYGAGAYICGEESALIESAEGKRGEPRDRPPFPIDKGYKQMPTVINNVETLCLAVRIIEQGSSWFRSLGTHDSSGTKLLSISGDCKFPGIYEIEWGMPVMEMLKMVGADQVQAVQVGGPSGLLIGPGEFDRILDYSDLATGGSIIIFNKSRDLLKDVVLNFTNFFIEESCGSCTTCRVIPVILRNKLEKIIDGHGVKKDIQDMAEWSKLIRNSRCGLGQTAANPVSSSIKNFKHLYDELIQKGTDFDEGFDLETSIIDACLVVGRPAEL